MVFENFNQKYPDITHGELFRVPEPAVSHEVAVASQQLEYLSVSFIVDAHHFFTQAVQPSCLEWPNLVSITLTSQLLEPRETTTEIEVMLQAAASVALKMPQLKTMEIWNGRKGLASLFKFQAPETLRPATITWRSTWNLTLAKLLPVIRHWEAVSLQLGGDGIKLEEQKIDEAVIRYHGDAIHQLMLSPVIRPVSLRQIQMEHHALG